MTNKMKHSVEDLDAIFNVGKADRGIIENFDGKEITASFVGMYNQDELIMF